MNRLKSNNWLPPAIYCEGAHAQSIGLGVFEARCAVLAIWRSERLGIGRCSGRTDRIAAAEHRAQGI